MGSGRSIPNPGNPKVVHHILAAVDVKPAPAKLDKGDAAPATKHLPDRHAAQWDPVPADGVAPAGPRARCPARCPRA